MIVIHRLERSLVWDRDGDVPVSVTSPHVPNKGKFPNQIESDNPRLPHLIRNSLSYFPLSPKAIPDPQQQASIHSLLLLTDPLGLPDPLLTFYRLPLQG